MAEAEPQPDERKGFDRRSLRIWTEGIRDGPGVVCGFGLLVWFTMGEGKVLV